MPEVKIPTTISKLVKRFDTHLDAYKNGKYNETQIRVEFIDPFFEALGWDIHNRSGRAEAHKDVIHEDAIKVAGKTKAPDYCFRVGGARKFFLEAKKPSVNIKENTNPVFQIRRYAWSSKLPLSILTDFEEFAVYDCRISPRHNEKARVGRVMYFTYDQYTDPNVWQEIAGTFSRDSVYDGSFDKYAEDHKLRRGTSEVDDAFLEEIEKWRDLLARRIAIKNPKLNQRELNFAVTRTIDRIIFLRICEDRGIEEYGQLERLRKHKNIYRQLVTLYHRADQKYHSGLFHFNNEKGQTEAPDSLTPGLVIEDKILKDMFRSLYPPESPYEFSVFPADILGHVYERFLGKTIRLTAGHRTKVEEKPEVRKAGGVYYTPSYVVDYIVRWTIGPLVKNKKPKAVSDLRILDPACGSGSFLLGAYQYLLDWHLNWYVANKVKEGKLHGRSAQPIFQAAGGDWKLTTTEKRRILLNNIHGVDIDPQAVDVAKLNLLLKVLEGESGETITRQISMFKARALPNLSENLKCGNSLIDPGFFSGQLLDLVDDDELMRINAFDWEQAFPEVFKNGGFDVVIGNPPWISLTGRFRNDGFSDEQIDFLVRRYEGNTYMPNMYEYFIAKGLDLTKAGGLFGYVVPDRFAVNDQFKKLRVKVLQDWKINRLWFRVPFPGITADTLVFVFENAPSKGDNQIRIDEYFGESFNFEQNRFEEDEDRKFLSPGDQKIDRILSAIDTLPYILPLSNVCESTSGFGGKSKLIESEKTNEAQIEVLKGDSIWKYEHRKSYWFEFVKNNITGRTTDKTKLGANPKILLRKTGDELIATYDSTGRFPEQSLYFLYNFPDEIDPYYLLGFLNSQVATFYYRLRLITNRKSIAQLKKKDLDRMPIPIPDKLPPQLKTVPENIAKLAAACVTLNTRIQAARENNKKNTLTRLRDQNISDMESFVCQLLEVDQDDWDVLSGG